MFVKRHYLDISSKDDDLIQNNSALSLWMWGKNNAVYIIEESGALSTLNPDSYTPLFLIVICNYIRENFLSAQQWLLLKT